MLILIEGVDRTGKSTLAEQLHAFTGGMVKHFSKPTAHPIDEYVGPIAAYNPPKHRGYILDRGHVGETVWPIIFERDTELDVAGRRWIEMFYRSRGAVLIHADRVADDAWMVELLKHKEPIQGEAAVGAKAAFERAVRASTLPTFKHQHGEWPEEALIQAAAQSVVCGRVLDICPHWVGSPRPRLLIVGHHGGGRWLPFPAYPDTTGHLLLGELDRWRDVAIVNAMHPDGDRVEPLPDLWMAMGQPQILALGSDAADILETAKLPHTAVGRVENFRRQRRPGNLGETIGRA